eukprot:EG_transcript_5583
MAPLEGPRYYLGVDCGTQSMKAVVVDAALGSVAEAAVGFDAELPAYGTAGGCHRQGDRVTAPPLMWVEALELLLDKLKAVPSCPDFTAIAALGLSAQQHATVYWRTGAEALLAGLTAAQPLVQQLHEAFAVSASPIWMDAATAAQCRRLEEALGGAAAVAEITGSRAYERFSGNQIAYIYDHHRDQFDSCDRIGLASSLLPSLCLGRYAPIDAGDGAGMNLLDVRTRAWHGPALAAAAGPTLLAKLGPSVVPSYAVLGPIAPYLTERWGFAPQCQVVAGSGDNNNALVGMKARADDTVVSLGTSDTVTASVRSGTGQVAGHLLCHPILPAGYMAMLCYSNGSITREAVRDEAVGPDWDRFALALQATPVGNDGHMGIYFLTQEIIPQYRQKGTYRFDPTDNLVDQFPACPVPGGNYDVRALVEGQCLAKRLHAARLGYRVTGESRLVACGGGSASVAMLQVLADVFGVPVYRDPAAGVNGAAYGAALRAMHALALAAAGGKEDASEAVYAALVDRAPPFELVCEPNAAHHAVYCRLLRRYAHLQSLVPAQPPTPPPGT